GFPLFRRTSRGIELTERGRTFLYEAERVVGDVLSLSDTARRLRGAPSDTLTIGMGSGMAQMFMPRLFGDLKNILPGVRLEILTAPTTTIFDDLRRSPRRTARCRHRHRVRSRTGTSRSGIRSPHGGGNGACRASEAKTLKKNSAVAVEICAVESANVTTEATRLAGISPRTSICRQMSCFDQLKHELRIGLK